MTKTEKEFYLDIASTLRGELMYRPVQDLSSSELKQQDELRLHLNSLTDQLAGLATLPLIDSGLFSGQWSNWELDMTQFLAQREEEERKLVEMQAEAAPVERSLRIEEEAVRRALALDSQRPDLE